MQSFEVVEPELRIEMSGVILNQRELHPPHRLIEPARRRDARADRIALRNGTRLAGCEPCADADDSARSRVPEEVAT